MAASVGLAVPEGAAAASAVALLPLLGGGAAVASAFASRSAASAAAWSSFDAPASQQSHVKTLLSVYLIKTGHNVLPKDLDHLTSQSVLYTCAGNVVWPNFYG